jgi:hypothetical protein
MFPPAFTGRREARRLSIASRGGRPCLYRLGARNFLDMLEKNDHGFLETHPNPIIGLGPVDPALE